SSLATTLAKYQNLSSLVDESTSSNTACGALSPNLGSNLIILVKPLSLFAYLVVSSLIIFGTTTWGL
ncbi:hypothetical protein WICPIJ_008303, partial [Wickerhamomyces pijperi]